MHNTDYTQLGIVKRPHGLKGHLIAQFDLALITLANIQFIFLQQGHTYVPYQLVHYTLHHHQATLKLQGVDELTTALQLKGKAIFIPQALLSQTMVADLVPQTIVGYQVVEVSGKKLGTIKRIEQLSTQKMFVIDYQQKELLVPANQAFIQHIDPIQKHITLQLPANYIQAVFAQ